MKGKSININNIFWYASDGNFVVKIICAYLRADSSFTKNFYVEFNQLYLPAKERKEID